jgi:glutamate dehydrogenase (NADP+)
MAIVRPFRAVRPRKDLVEKVVALPYDVMDRKEAKAMAKGNPYSFLHISRSEIDLPSSVDQYDKKVYKKARRNLDIFQDDGILVQDEVPMIYVYRQVMNGESQTGFVANTSIDDYVNNVIKKHELTLLSKEQDRIKHFDACDANTSPIFMAYRSNEKLAKILEGCTKAEPELNIETEDGVLHIVWPITDEALIREISETFEGIESLYIADGHHRTASAAKVALKRRADAPNCRV